MTIDRRDYYEKEYIRKASRGGLLSLDIGLLVRQYRSHTQANCSPLTRDQRWAWVTEAASVLRLVESHCRSLLPSETIHPAIALADTHGALKTPVERRQWAAQAYAALLEAQNTLRQADPRTSSFSMTDSVAWNLLMAEGRRPVSYKVGASASPPERGHQAPVTLSGPFMEACE